jgi:hypothetical protein
MHQGTQAIARPAAKLEGKARAMIDAYLALPVGAKPSCPYFNNRRHKVRGSLRVVKGKGTPEEIAEETTIDAKLCRIDLSSLSTDRLKEFIVSRKLGVDCSGFAYHVLNALCQEKTGRSVQGFVATLRTGFIGRLAAKLRPAENIGVATFRDDRNSREVALADAMPGDFIAMIGTGADKQYNHMVVITGVESTESGWRLSYAHSYAWPSDGHFGHGVREGEIVTKEGQSGDLLGGIWKENGMIGADNFTHQSALGAKEVTVRRLLALE